MMDETGGQRIYVYKVGPFTFLFGVLFAGLSAFGGLHLIANTIVTEASDAPFWSVIWGLGLLLGAALIARWLHQNSLSSQTVALWPDKVQLPMTKGDEDSDYLFLNEVLGIKIDRFYHDHGPALIVSTKSEPVAYKSMYFDNYANFEDFCGRFTGAFENQEAQKQDVWDWVSN